MLPSTHNADQRSVKIFVRLPLSTLSYASTLAFRKCMLLPSRDSLIGTLKKIEKIEVYDGDANQWVVGVLQNKRKRNHCVLHGELLE